MNEKCYKFSPKVINNFYHIIAQPEEKVEDWDSLAKTLTRGRNIHWPSNDVLYAVDLSSRYAILHWLALLNWIPYIHSRSLSKDLCALVYRIRIKKKLDLGTIIFNRIMSFTRPKEQKVKLPFQSIIYGILTAQGLEQPVETIIKVLDNYHVDHKLLKGKHVWDVVHVNPPNVPTLVPEEDDDNSPLAGRDKKLVVMINATINDLSIAQRLIV